MHSKIVLGLSTLLLIFATLSARVSAQSCSDINLVSEIGPVRDQGHTGTCYAFTAADLLSHKYRGQFPLGFSPIAIAFWYGVHSDIAAVAPFPISAGLFGGSVDDSIEQSYGEWNSEDLTQNWKPGLCRYERLPSDSPGDLATDRFLSALDMMAGLFNRVTARVRTDRNYLNSSAGQTDITQIQNYLNTSHAGREQVHANWCNANLRSAGFTAADCTNFARLIVQIVDDGVFATRTREHITKVMYQFGRGIKRFSNLTNRHLSSDSWGQLLNLPSSQRLMLFGEYVRLACGEYAKPQPQYAEVVDRQWDFYPSSLHWPAVAQAYLDYFLSHGVPVGIGYDANGLIIKDPTNANFLHASVVVGRKLIDGECNYLVKNSFGNSWLPSKFGLAARQALDQDGTTPLWGYFYFPASKFGDLIPDTQGGIPRPRLRHLAAISIRHWSP